MPQSWRKMRSTASIWMGPSSQQNEQVDVFAEHLVVRRVATDGHVRPAVE